jgi:glycine betaine transporter
MGILCSRGSADPPRLITAFWGIAAAVAAAVLLLAGGLTALQQTMVVMSAPFMVVMVILTVGMLKQLRAEPLPAVRGLGTDVVPAPATHQLDVTGPPIPAATPTTGRDVSA